jgi:hypothetical protein
MGAICRESREMRTAEMAAPPLSVAFCAGMTFRAKALGLQLM